MKAILACLVINCLLVSQVKCQVFQKSSKNRTTLKSNTSEIAIAGFEDGQYFTISNVASGRFLTAEGANFTRGANVVAKDWNGDDSQLWLALLAPKTRSVLARRNVITVPSSRFLLIPKRQAYSNSKNDNETRAAGLTYNLGTLPQLTEVLTLDSLTGNLTTEVGNMTADSVLVFGSSSQQWIAEDDGNGRIVIRNFGNNQCVKNFDYKPANIFQKIASFISRIRKPYKPKPDPKPLSTLDCSQSDVTQKWVPERI